MINPSYLPESVAFKRLLRDLTRQANYVPPFQERTTPLALTPRAAESDEADAAPAQTFRIGAWVFQSNENGDVVARHDNGTEREIAALPEGEAQHG